MRNIIDELLEIGFTEYEAKAYHILLKQNMASATEITKISGVPRGRIYDIINQLIEKGFCITVPGTVKKFKAVDPESAIHNLIDQRKKKEVKMLETAKKLKQMYANQKDTSSPLDYIHVYTNKSSMINKFNDIVKNTKKINRSFNKPPYISINKIFNSEVSKPVANTLKKGIAIKVIYEIEEDNLENFIAYVKHFSQMGEQARVIKKLPLKMIIADELTIMFAFQNRDVSKNNFTSMVVEHSDLTFALIELFETYWEKSMTLDEFLKIRNL